MRKTSTDHQKRYGQYFSGARVAELLVALLPKDTTIECAIDPMAGVGDLLKAIEPRISGSKKMLGIEIDPPVAKECAERLPDCKIIQGDAFSCSDILTKDGWDLVITNPPYVRYQLQGAADDGLPSGKELRRKLCEQITALPYLSQSDKSLLLHLAKNYSGLSDMAVPSWILCASLVKLEGLLAIVVPDTWLSREYALPIQYMLTKYFDILTIVKDTDASWFEDALVRTCLVVAKRKPTATLDKTNNNTLYMDLESSVAGTHSLIDKLAFGGMAGFEALALLIEKCEEEHGTGYNVTLRSPADLFPYIFRNRQSAKWMLKEDCLHIDDAVAHPSDILQILRAVQYSGEFTILDDLGIKCGQGLRTGANDFFYLTISDKSDSNYIADGKPWYKKAKYVEVPAHNIVRTVQNRGQVSGLTVSAGELTTGLLYIQDEVRAKDRPYCTVSLKEHAGTLGGTLENYIDAAEAFKNSKGLGFREYSAVKTNEKIIDKQYQRFWYMLPALMPRHTPALCMTRVNATVPECIFVHQEPNSPIAADANFVTLWGSNPINIKIAFALLNSLWTRCYLETLCTVMGGGALKLEAAQLRKLQFPAYSKIQLSELEKLGKALAQRGSMDESLQTKIDKVSLSPFPDSDWVEQQLRKLLLRKLNERSAKR